MVLRNVFSQPDNHVITTQRPIKGENCFNMSWKTLFSPIITRSGTFPNRTIAAGTLSTVIQRRSRPVTSTFSICVTMVWWNVSAWLLINCQIHSGLAVQGAAVFLEINSKRQSRQKLHFWKKKRSIICWPPVWTALLPPLEQKPLRIWCSLPPLCDLLKFTF